MKCLGIEAPDILLPDGAMKLDDDLARWFLSGGYYPVGFIEGCASSESGRETNKPNTGPTFDINYVMRSCVLLCSVASPAVSLKRQSSNTDLPSFLQAS